MTNSLLFQPHVGVGDSVVTPDLMLERAFVSTPIDGGHAHLPLPLDRLTTATEIQVVGKQTFADVALLLLMTGDEPLIGLASDHVDNSRTQGTSHQVCAKPICRTAWRYHDVADHLGGLILYAWSGGPDGTEFLVQEGSVSELGDIEAIVSEGNARGTAILCAGLPTAQPFVKPMGYRLQIHDPILNRAIEHRYRVTELEDTL